ncbi:MAG: hypothetical protein V1709_10810, partial [Planctomycetota bacterium]
KNGGCALFFEANNWNAEHTEIIKLYDSEQTYDISVAENRPISPITCDPSFDPNCKVDANKLIKVNKDRQCAEWLTCKSSAAVWNPDTSQFQIICDGLDTCIEYDHTNNITKCKKWTSYDTIVNPLTTELYQTRVTGQNDHLQWSDKEYIGYAIPDLLSIKDLTSYAFGDDKNNPEARIVHAVYNATDPNSRRNIFCANADNCCVNPDNSDKDGALCTATVNNFSGLLFTGECQEGICWVSPLVNDTSTSTFSLETRGYAVADAPFPDAIEPEGDDRLQAYSGANICEKDTATINGCELKYKKVTYSTSGVSRYYPINYTEPEGICISGDPEKINNRDFNCTAMVEGREVGKNDLCDSLGPNPQNEDDTIRRGDGVCAKKTAVETVYNWPGICLEYDYSSPLINDAGQSYMCNQWYPANRIDGTESLFDNYKEAGFYNPAGNDLLFCAIAEPYELEADRYYCGGVTNGWCNLLYKVPAGARININAVSGYEDLLNQHYLKNVYRFVAKDEATEVFYPNGIGWDRIEKLVQIESPAFKLNDFVTVSGQNLVAVPVYPKDVIQKFFDAEIEQFYYDWGYSFTMTPEGSYHFGEECEDGIGVLEWMAQPPQNNYCVDDREHLVYQYRGFGDNCGTGGAGIDRGFVWCNPLTYNYYVKVEKDTAIVCEEKNCSLNLGKGYICMYTPATSPTYGSMLYDNPPGNWSWSGPILDMTSISECGGDPNCEFIYCVNDLFPMSTHNNDPDINGRLLNVNYCSDYGGFTSEIKVDESFFRPESYTNIKSIDSCFDKIYKLVTVNDPAEHQEARFKDNVHQALINELFGNSTSTTGCLKSAIGASCYPEETKWSPFTGVDCGEGSNCYQMCSTIAELDAEGNNS